MALLKEDADKRKRELKDHAKKDNTSPDTKKRNRNSERKMNKIAVANTPLLRQEISVNRRSSNCKKKGSSWLASPSPKLKIHNN